MRKLAARSSCCLSLVSCPAHTSQKSLVLGHRMGDMRHTTRAYLGHKVGQHAFLERKTQNMPQKKCQVAVWPNQNLKACANKNCWMLVTTTCLVSMRQGRHDTSSHSRQMRNSQKSPVSIKTNSTPCDPDMIFVKKFTLPGFQAKSFTLQKCVIYDNFSQNNGVNDSNIDKLVIFWL